MVYSVPSNVRLIRVADLLRFARSGVKVYMKHLHEPISIGETPGSVSVSHKLEDFVFSKIISASMAACSTAMVERLNMLTAEPLVVLYADESGCEMVCGSPDHPLRLYYAFADGGIKVELKGRDVLADGVLAL